jgi:hypothetical protein
MTWYLRHLIGYTGFFVSWMPHYFYLLSLSRKINKIYLMRGGKYLRLQTNEYYGEKMNVWITIRDLHLLNKDLNRFDDSLEFLNKEGQLLHDVGVQVDHYLHKGIPHNDEVIYFIKEGKVHSPEVFDMVVRGYNIDDSDYEINTEDNIRWFEPDRNY